MADVQLQSPHRPPPLKGAVHPNTALPQERTMGEGYEAALEDARAWSPSGLKKTFEPTATVQEILETNSVPAAKSNAARGPSSISEEASKIHSQPVRLVRTKTEQEGTSETEKGEEATPPTTVEERPAAAAGDGLPAIDKAGILAINASSIEEAHAEEGGSNAQPPGDTTATDAEVAEDVPPPLSISNDSPQYVLLLHQEATYRKLLLQEIDMCFVTIAERGWYERDALTLEEMFVLYATEAIAGDEAEERHRLSTEMAQHRFETLQLTERKQLGGDELMGRRAIAAEEAAEWQEAFEMVGMRERFWLTHREERVAKRNEGKDLFMGIDLPPDALVDASAAAALNPQEALMAEAKAFARQPVPPPTSNAALSFSASLNAGSRLSAYKAQRRYRQDVTFRRAVDAERAAMAKAEADSAAAASDRLLGRGGPIPTAAIDRMVAAFSAPDNLITAMVGIEHSEQHERTAIIKARTMWHTTVIAAHRRYRALTVESYRHSISAICNEEIVSRAAIINQFFFMMLEFCEALEILHRRDLQQREIPRAAEAVASVERRGWLAQRRLEMARKDREHQDGEAHDAMMRRKYFEWNFAMLQARGAVEAAESEARVLYIINKERKAFQTVTALANTEYPNVLVRHLRREALLKRLSTVVEWTPETYERVYLGEADARNTIARREKDVWLRIMGDEAKEYLVARREEVSNNEIHKLMAAYDARRAAVEEKEKLQQQQRQQRGDGTTGINPRNNRFRQQQLDAAANDGAAALSSSSSLPTPTQSSGAPSLIPTPPSAQ